jgi:putative transposase
VKYRFIEAEKASYPTTVLCDVLEVGRSGFYAWRSRAECRRAQEDRRLAVDVKVAFESSRLRYGSPRVYAELRAQGLAVGRHRVARLMRIQGLQARKRRRFIVRTTDSRHDMPVAKNVVARKFDPPTVNRIWAGDVTYIHTLEGWLFLAVLLDLYSRRVVGWAMSDSNDEALTLKALEMAIQERRPRRGTLVHHSDRGSTYASTEYQDVLRRNGIQCSMSRKGNCWDNAVAESFFSTLKTEGLAHVTFPTRSTARREVFEFIATFYNSTRRHSYLDYRSPIDFERSKSR